MQRGTLLSAFCWRLRQRPLLTVMTPSQARTKHAQLIIQHAVLEPCNNSRAPGTHHETTKCICTPSAALGHDRQHMSTIHHHPVHFIPHHVLSLTATTDSQ
jgi:hypothetical protein